MASDKEMAIDENTLSHLLNALSAETLDILAELRDAQPGAAEWMIAGLPLGSRSVLHAYCAIRIGAPLDPVGGERALREVEILPLGRSLIQAAHERVTSDEVVTLRRLVEEALAD